MKAVSPASHVHDVRKIASKCKVTYCTQLKFAGIYMKISIKVPKKKKKCLKMCSINFNHIFKKVNLMLSIQLYIVYLPYKNPIN